MKTTALALLIIIGVIFLGAASGSAVGIPARVGRSLAIDSASAAPLAAPATDVQAVPSAGCTHAGSANLSGTMVRTLESSYWTRSYRVLVGASAKPGQPMPVVLNFHGRGGSGAAIEDYSGLLPVSDREGFLLVSPDGLGSPTGWGAGASLPQWGVDDIQFGKDLIAAIKDTYCIDSTRIYAVGHSNGAFMAARLACALHGQIAAVAPVAGVYMPPEGCSTPVPIIAFHGAADTVVPFEGGTVRETYHYRGAEREIADWAAADHCTDAASTTNLNARVVIERHSHCAQPVELVVINGAGHGWPGMAGTDLASQIDTADMIWSFFKDFRSSAT
jgi:polyhydroxybutyrate depolymerase